MVLERIAEFLGQLLRRHDHIDERHATMFADLATIIAKLNDQGKQIAAQGAQIDKLIADRDQQEQADLQKISDLIDANATASTANASKLASALAPDTDASSGQGSAPVTTVDTASGTTTAVDPASGTTVVLDHSTGQTSTVDASGASAPTDPSLAAAAAQAAADAGAVVPTP